MNNEENASTKLAIFALLVGILIALLLPHTGPLDAEMEYTGISSGAVEEHNRVLSYVLEQNPDVVLARTITNEVLRQAAKYRIAPGWIVSIMAYESWGLDSMAVSSAGARGLMQIMPLHVPELMVPCNVANTQDLFDVIKNICSGVYILSQKFDRCDGMPKCALLAYNGCVVRDEDPHRACYSYPQEIEDRILEFLAES